jgi:hypothetical protein
MDWGDACEQIAVTFSSLEGRIAAYLAKHTPLCQ